MANRGGGATVSSELTRLLLKGVSMGRGAIDELLGSAGIDPALLQAAGERIPFELFDRLWRELEEASADPCFGLHLGELPDGLPAGNAGQPR